MGSIDGTDSDYVCDVVAIATNQIRLQVFQDHHQLLWLVSDLLNM